MLKGLKMGLGALAVAGVVGAAAPAHAASCSGSASTCTGAIELLYPSPQADQVYVDLEGAVSGLQCTPTSGKYFVLNLDTEVKKATWQLLLSAFLSGKTVTVRVTAAAGPCNIQYVTVAP